MRKLLLGLFLGLLAVVHSTPVPSVTQVPVNNEDEVIREAMTDGFLVPSLTTEKPTTTTEASQQTESTSSADNGSRDSSSTTESSKTNATAPASQHPEYEDIEGSALGVTYAFWSEGSTTTTSTQEASDATESTTTTSTQETSSATESTTSMQEAFGASESTTMTSTQEASDSTESITTMSMHEASDASESTTSMQDAFDASESTTMTPMQEAFDASESTTMTPMQEAFDASESTTSMLEAFDASESSTSMLEDFDASESPTMTPMQEASDASESTTSMLEAFNPSESTTPTSMLEFDFMSDDSILGKSEDAFSWLGSATTSISTDSPASARDDEPILVTVDLLGSEWGSGMIEEPTISKTARGRGFNMANPEILVEKPEKVVEQHDPEQHKGHTTPGWIIIVGFVVGIAALVMLCLAIATRDKWNGPRQASTEKTEANPSNQQRGLEMETFLSREEPRENGKAAEYTVIPLDELSESYS